MTFAQVGCAERSSACVQDHDAAAAMRSLIDRIVLTPGRKRGEMDAVLHGDFGTILEWVGGGNGSVDTSGPV